jgi:hypothetical protein
MFPEELRIKLSRIPPFSQSARKGWGTRSKFEIQDLKIQTLGTQLLPRPTTRSLFYPRSSAAADETWGTHLKSDN